MTQIPLLARQLGAVALLVLLWAAVVAGGLVSPSVLPPVGKVAGQAVTLVGEASFWRALASTLFDALRGLIIGAAIGIPTGLIVGMWSGLERTVRLVVDFGRSFPVVALLPVLILLFGASSTMKVIAISIACFFPTFLQSLYGARRLEPMIAETVRAYRVPLYLRFIGVVLPSAGPYVATGMRIASSVAILVAVSVELVSLAPGLGREIALLRGDGNAAGAFAYVLFTGLLGVTLNAVWDAAERRLLGWHLQNEHAAREA